MSHDLVVLIGHDRPEVVELQARTSHRVNFLQSAVRSVMWFWCAGCAGRFKG